MKDIGRADDIVLRVDIVGKSIVIEGACSLNPKETELFPSVTIKYIKFEETQKVFSLFHSQKIPT